MNRNEAITALVNYALEKELIEQEEKVWAVNRILEVMQADSFSWEESAKGKEAGLTEILDTLIDDAYERGVLEENSVVYRDFLIQNSGQPDTATGTGDEEVSTTSGRIFPEGNGLVLSVQSGHELYPKGQSCERYPLEDRDRIW